MAHCIFQELSDIFRTSEVLKAVKKEMQVQARRISTTLLTTSPTNAINPNLLQDVGFDPMKAPVTILPTIDSTSRTKDSKLDCDQESARAGGPQATALWYIQPCPKAVEASHTGTKHCPGLTKPSTSLFTLATARVLHLPIENAHAGWFDGFLINMDIPSDIHPKHQQCGLDRMPPRYICVPRDVLPLPIAKGCFSKAMTQTLLMPEATTLNWECGTTG